LNGVESPVAINSTCIVLIPKLPNADSMS
jgi:hypothetical protein